MKDSDRNLPRVLNCAMIITTSSFVLVVIAFYLCLPMGDIRAKTTLAVVSIAFTRSLCTCLLTMLVACTNFAHVLILLR
jgi:hypothetical protein